MEGPTVSSSAAGTWVRARRWSAAAVALAVVLWGGYSHHWPWTGIDGATATLWDWLHLLLLPLAFVALPVWTRADTRVAARTKGRGAATFAVFVIVVVLGYAIPWAWTGFRGNTVWDWLELVLLPLAVVLAPRLAELRHVWGRRETIVASGCALVFAVLVVGGYLGPWAWTGFTGNTLWDWLHLLVLPLLLPTIVIPALTPRMIGEVVYLDADGNPIAEASVEEPEAPGPPESAPAAQLTPPSVNPG